MAHRRLARSAEGHSCEASECVIDAQSVKTSANVPLTSQGVDAAKKIIGCKRRIATTTLGLLLAVLVTAASVTGLGRRYPPARRRPLHHPQGSGRRRLPPLLS